MLGECIFVIRIVFIACDRERRYSPLIRIYNGGVTSNEGIIHRSKKRDHILFDGGVKSQ